MTSTAKLKAAAEKARWGDWSAYKPHSGARGYEVRVGIEAVAQHCLKDDAAFIAEASPKAVLELIAALEAAERQKGYLREQCNEWERKAISNFENCSEMAARIEELESQRQMAFIASNRWADKFREAEKRIAELEKRVGAAGINLETGGEA
ncbi:ead/Ea22-like family protein [Cronobacter sakazakii]|uniref:ead/Ea22-like family protein n=1 Tax=Cronobacter sakazakii TaxID=28141 RepID=UPI000F5C400C|nr:ead/Ea22-like family protein [Cronobacter sakazakii]